MPELDFYLNKTDVMRIVESVLRQGGYFVPHLNYEEPAYIEVRDMATFESTQQDFSAKLFSIIHDQYYECPLEICPLVKDGIKKFFIMQRNGGPAIDFYLPKLYEKNGIYFLPSGMISYYPSYWDTKCLRNRKSPDNLKTFYRGVCGEIRRGAHTIKAKKRTYYVEASTNADLEIGIKLGGVFVSERCPSEHT